MTVLYATAITAATSRRLVTAGARFARLRLLATAMRAIAPSTHARSSGQRSKLVQLLRRPVAKPQRTARRAAIGVSLLTEDGSVVTCHRRAVPLATLTP